MKISMKIGYLSSVFLLCASVWGCAPQSGGQEQGQPEKAEVSQQTEAQTETQAETQTADIGPESAAPTVVSADWSEYFGELNGAAVIYDAAKQQYSVFNQELAEEERSPCSTFKIVSSLAGLETGVIVPGDSVRTWNGRDYWMEEWNQDLDFERAFRASCVWYFREVTDEIGKEAIQEELNRLQYGNRDISDWGGELNTNNSDPTLTGFWIESSLKISAAGQVGVMERIFGEDSIYKPETIEQLKQVMAVPDAGTECAVYGKTGMGKAGGIVVDSWFTGFAECDSGNKYFCVYLGETQGAEVSSAKAREIAIKIITEKF